MIMKNNLKLFKTKIRIYEEFYNDDRNVDVALCLISHVIDNPDNPDITYGELAKKVGDNITARTIQPFLGNISEVCKENGFPLLSAIVINKKEKMPGDGFYIYFFGKSDPEFKKSKYTECRNSIISFKKWEKLEYAIERRSR